MSLLVGGAAMEQDYQYRKQVVMGYKEIVMPLLRYLPWFEQNGTQRASTTYQEDSLAENSVSFPVYNSTVLSFVKDAAKTELMDKNYRYIYTRNRIKSHDDERRLIQQATWQEWDILKGIMSYYVLGGRTKGLLWNEAVEEEIFYLLLKKMKEIIEYWDRPIEVERIE